MNKRILISVTTLLLLTVFLQSVFSQNTKPKTVRDYFMLLPQRYFVIEACSTEYVFKYSKRYGKKVPTAVNRDCLPLKVEYLKNFLKVEDTANGYLEGSGDGAQASFKMALFKRPNGTNILGLNVFGEMAETYYFLEYKNRKWIDISKSVIPNYSQNNAYELPHMGKIVKVYNKKENYDLIWKNGSFQIKH